ncbi:hypothetical protein OEZ85_007266 [Tetradesmus obliquus]|uniref:Uncharacterized protein n=1 Tax=Tetradesmus obliquus TaxID=3088 RepID=A0ABY8U202_TETOB|nr:hypothetical protein OEZ85_007266 [Tetradesmus obliquus]
MGRFLVTQTEGGGSASARSSRPGSVAGSTHASRAGSPRAEHAALPLSRLGSHKSLAAVAGACATPSGEHAAQQQQAASKRANGAAAAAVSPAAAEPHL